VLEKVNIRIYKTMLSPVVLYGCETLTLTLREEHRLFDNRVLRRICGLKKDEMMRGLRKLHNEELHESYSSPGIFRMIIPGRMRWAGHVASMAAKWNAYSLSVGKPEGKWPLGR
jgi:hypothetical protein